jgi:glycosyl hydrolase family 2
MKEGADMMTNVGRTVVMAAFLAAASAAWAAPEFVWIEAEKPAKASIEFKGGGRPGVTSGESHLSFVMQKGEVARKGLPAEGIQFSYKANVATAGRYDLWLREGFEFVRAPLDWRADGGKWVEMTAAQTFNTMAFGKWTEMGWTNAGTLDLTAGEHTVDIRYTKPGKDGRLLIALDCLVLVKGKWTPEGMLKPGEKYDAQPDRDAAKHVFTLGAGGDDPARRFELELKGLWEITRMEDPDLNVNTDEPVKRLPTPGEYPLQWRGIEVPGDAFARPDMDLAHILFYRTKLVVPKALTGRGFHLHFSGTNWIASVIVNGKFCGSRKSVLVPWDADVTSAVKPGQENTIVIAIKSPAYGMAASPAGERRGVAYPAVTVNDRRNTPMSGMHGIAAPFTPSIKGEGRGTQVGITNPVALVVTGGTYTRDIFIRTSVTKKRLDADITVLNPTGKPIQATVQCAAVHDRTGQVEQTFPAVQVTVPAGGSETVATGGAWADPKLWWPAERVDDKPDCYIMRTTVSVGGKPVDVQEELFGFRELTYDGRHMLLNGIRWHLWNWHKVKKVETDEQWLEEYFAQNNRFHRMGYEADHRWGYREKALDFFDRNGIPGRLSTCADGMKMHPKLEDPRWWQNQEEHARQVAEAYRNHPSVFMYSLGNEVMLVTARIVHGKTYGEMERRAAKVSQAAREVDPTRRSFQDGGGDLGGLIDMHCPHYSWVKGAGFPFYAYDYPLYGDAVPMPREKLNNVQKYMWSGKVPAIYGEVAYYGGNATRADWVGGPAIYRSRANADRAYGRFVRISVEGARWQDATGICPWVTGLEDTEISYARRAAFIREHNSTFRPGAVVRRTVGIFNDGRDTDPLTLKWRLVFDGKTVDSAEKTYKVAPGRHVDDTISARLPAGLGHSSGSIELELLAAGKSVFSDAREIVVLPVEKAVPGLSAAELSVWDPTGDVRKWLDGLGQKYTAVAGPGAIPATATVLIVGRNALPKTSMPKPKRGQPLLVRKARPEAVAIAAFVAGGGTAIVLEQDAPLTGVELPLPGIGISSGALRRGHGSMMEHMGASGSSGALSFPAAPAHPVLKTLGNAAFFTWTGPEAGKSPTGENTFRGSYATPSRGPIAIIKAGAELGLTPLMEVPGEKGTYLLSQMLVGERLGHEPAADRLLHNALTWAAARGSAEPPRIVAVVDDEKLLQFLTDASVKFDRGQTLADALKIERAVLIVQASAKMLQQLTARSKDVKAFCDAGGWLMLCGLDGKGLPAFNKLVGVEHRIRRFGREKVILDRLADPLLLGITDRDLAMTSADMVSPWAKVYYVSATVFSNVVDGVDIAPFAKFADGVHRNTVNGLVVDDSWRYISYMKVKGHAPEHNFKNSVEFTFDRPETFARMNVWNNKDYHFIKDIKLIFDGDEAAALPFTLKPEVGMQELKFQPRKVQVVTLRIESQYANALAKQDICGLDLVQLFRQAPEALTQRAVLLTKPAGMVKYAQGKGGIVLNQLDYVRDDGAGVSSRGKPVDRGNRSLKLAIMSNLVRNLSTPTAE